MRTDNITVNTQSSICIEGSEVLYFDPIQIRGGSRKADIVLVTHSHYDHLDPESISLLMEKRRPAYENAADLTVATDDKTPEAIAKEILEMV